MAESRSSSLIHFSVIQNQSKFIHFPLHSLQLVGRHGHCGHNLGRIARLLENVLLIHSEYMKARDQKRLILLGKKYSRPANPADFGNQILSNFLPFALQKTPSRGRKSSPQTGRKCLPTTYLTKRWCPEEVRTLKTQQ